VREGRLVRHSSPDLSGLAILCLAGFLMAESTGSPWSSGMQIPHEHMAPPPQQQPIWGVLPQRRSQEEMAPLPQQQLQPQPQPEPEPRAENPAWFIPGGGWRL